MKNPSKKYDIFIGYPHGQKGWKVYNKDTNAFTTSRDVVFYEHIFLYAFRQYNITNSI